MQRLARLGFRTGRASSGGGGSGPTPPSTLFSADFTALTPGGMVAGAGAGSAFETATGLRLTRSSSNDTVQTPDNKTVQHIRLKWRAGQAPGATSPLSLTDGAGITIVSSVPGQCVFYYTIPAATLLAIAAATYVYDALADNSDSTTDCVLAGIATHQQVMTQ